ncbi:hypothetical protein TNCV_2236751 [Trichonephila clavipes]|nr:hypothetical protein TNCV_2236751 [Trichonephila clavipes]
MAAVDFCCIKIRRLGTGFNTQPYVQKASDKPTTPSSRHASLSEMNDLFSTFSYPFDKCLLAFSFNPLNGLTVQRRGYRKLARAGFPIHDTCPDIFFFLSLI